MKMVSEEVVASGVVYTWGVTVGPRHVSPTKDKMYNKNCRNNQYKEQNGGYVINR